MTVKYVHYKSASAKLIRNLNDTWTLKNVWSAEIKRGHGTGLMYAVENFADEMQVEVRLLVIPYGRSDGSGMNRKQLEEFYGKFGFEVGNDFLPRMMFRKPNSRN